MKLVNFGYLKVWNKMSLAFCSNQPLLTFAGSRLNTSETMEDTGIFFVLFCIHVI